ncbi:SDR family oxidoreductase [Nonomuraea polychroma]|uniref:SDR family oxidoreductase n=1 Tax=Nonomuraea polychroma TaxID=46176 RepID=UPI003D8D19D4
MRSAAGEAQVFLAGRTPATLGKIAAELGGAAEAFVVDALDEDAVGAFTDQVAERAGAIDVSFNAIGVQDVQKPLMEITAEEFARRSRPPPARSSSPPGPPSST